MKLAYLFVPAFFLTFPVSLPAATPPGKTQPVASPSQAEGLAKSDWASIRAAYEAGQHAFQAIPGGWQARNPGQRWIATFDQRGFVAKPKDGGWQWGLELKGYGFPGAERVIHSLPTVKAEGQRLAYGWDAAVQEWFVNDARGLEHGFTVKQRPAGGPSLEAQPSTLDFLLAVRGTLRTKVAADGLGIEFLDADGAAVLTYAGLKVWDADGKILRSHFEMSQPLTLNSQPTVRLLVEERGARYPLTIDPLAQQAYLKPAAVGTNQAGDQFGNSVSVSGDTVVVGAPGESSSTLGVNSTPNDRATNAGAAYVFVRSGTTWTQQAYLKPAAVGTNQAGDQFGWSVSVSGDTVAVGAPGEDSNTLGVNSTPNDASVAGLDSGAAYVFVRNGTTWTQQAYLKASNTAKGDQFGWSVAISSNIVVVGAPASSDFSLNSPGGAYIFARSGTTWTQSGYLTPSAVGTTAVGDQFGFSVAIDSATGLGLVGAPGDDSSTNSAPFNEDAPDSGAAYIFSPNGTSWTLSGYLKPAPVAFGFDAQDYHFGTSVAISGHTLVVGAPGENSSSTGVNSTPNQLAPNAGAVYVFNGSMLQAYLKPAAVGVTQEGDQFGWSVAITGNTVVVGAPAEDGSNAGENATPNEGNCDSGAAYVFTRSGTTWTQQAYLKASNNGGNDHFGTSVAVSGETVVAGAPGESSIATGVNSTGDDDSAPNSGAAYVFAYAPTVTGIAPASGPTTGGTSVTITGTRFAGVPAVTIGGVPATSVSVVNATNITATTPAHLPGLADVVVATFPGSPATGTNLFTYAAPPKAVFVNPPGGSTNGGTSVTIYGSSFTGATGVSFGGTAATSFTVNSDTRITATTAAHAAGLVNVVVTLPLVTGTGTNLFTYASLSNTNDTDGDGLNDAAEFALAALGFNYQVAQPALVSSFLTSDAIFTKSQYDTNFTLGRLAGRSDVTNSPNTYGLYTLSQVQALNVDTPLLTKNPTNGMFKLTIGVQKATFLTNFLAFPMNGAGSTTILNAAGKVEFNFTDTNNAAFFRLQSQ